MQAAALLLVLLLPYVAFSVQTPLLPQIVQDSSIIGGLTPAKPANYSTPPGTAAPYLTVRANATLTLQHVFLDDRESRAPWDAKSWEANLQLPTVVRLEAGTQLVLESVTLLTTCQTLRTLQSLTCRQLVNTDDILSLQIVDQDLWVPSWSNDMMTITDLHITCRLPGQVDPLSPMVNTSLPTKAERRPASELMACSVARVHSWYEIQVTAAYLQTYSWRTMLVVMSNITIGADNMGDVPIYGNVSVHGPSSQPTGAWMTFGFLHGRAMWTLTEEATLTITAITFLTLPLGPYEKYPWSTFGWPMWMVNMNRCQKERAQVYVQNCTLVMPPETMDYMSHWVGEVSSPFPDRAAAAAWYTTDYTCNPPQRNPFLLNEVRLLSQRLWVTENATGFGVQFVNTTFTDTLPAGAVVTVAPLQLTKLFSDPYMPFPDISWVMTPDDFAKALSQGNTSAIVVLTNMSLTQPVWDTWPGRSVNVSSQVTQVSGWPARPTYLDMQRIPNVINVRSQLILRNLVFMNGAQNDLNIPGVWAGNLTMLEWSFRGDRSTTLLRMESVTLVIPPTEFELLLSSAATDAVDNSTGNATLTLNPDGTITGSGAPGTYWGGTALQGGKATVGVLVEDGMVGFNVTLWSQPPDSVLPFPNMNITVVVDNLDDTTPPFRTPPRSTNNTGFVVGITVPVTCVVLAAVIASIVLLRRRNLQRRRPSPPTPDTPKACSPKHLGNGHVGTGQHLKTGSGSGDDKDSPLSQFGDGTSNGSLTDSSVVLHMGPHTPMPAPNHGSPAWNGHATLGTNGVPFVQGSQHRGASHAVPMPGVHGNVTAGRSTSNPPSGPLSSASSSTHSSVTIANGIAANSPSHVQGVVEGSSGRNPSRFVRRQPMGPSQRGLHGELGTSPGQGMFEDDASYVDSFDLVPEHHEQLLINCFDLSKDLQASLSMPDVASQLKAMVSHMQSELGDQEVEITRVIGQGGGGVVYQGTWRGLTVAVKTMTFSVVPMQPMSRRQHRAMNEAAICKTLQHPNIVATYAYDVHALTPTRYGSSEAMVRGPSTQSQSGSGSKGHLNGTSNGTGQQAPHSVCATEFKLFIIQEFCDGGSLKAAMEDGKLHDRTTGTPKPVMSHILQLATDIAAGLAHVHSRFVVHGDLTPANILLKPSLTAESGYVAKIADFGLSWKLAQGQAHVSNARQGTSFYIAPEVLHVGIMSKAADVFSFGMVLHEMYEGEPVWRRQLANATNAAFRRPGVEQLSWGSDVPEDFKTLVESCLASDPQLRPSMFQVVEQLLAMQRDLWDQDSTNTNHTPSSAQEEQDSALRSPSWSGANAALSKRSRPSAGRHPTSGLLHEGDVKAVYQAVRSSSHLWGPPQELPPETPAETL